MNLGYAFFAFSVLVWHVSSNTAIPPAYANCSTLPLYGRSGVPSIADISALVTDNGWLEALLGAVVLTKTSAIEQRLHDPEDGTIGVALPNVVGEVLDMDFPKKPFPSDTANCGNTSTAWVSSMFDGLTNTLKADNITGNMGVGLRVSRGLNAILGLSGFARNYSCLIPPISGTRSLYELASEAPVVAAMYPNTTQPQYANRMVAVTASNSLNSTTNTISFASISVDGRQGISDMSWSDWLVNCEVMFST